MPIRIEGISTKLYDPDIGSAVAAQVVFNNNLVKPGHYLDDLISHAQTQRRGFFLQGSGFDMAQKATHVIYDTLGHRLGIYEKQYNGEKPGYGGAEFTEGFYERHMASANEAVKGLLRKIAPDHKEMLGLLSQVELIQSPASMIQLLVSPFTDPRLKFELTRQLSLFLNSVQLESQKHELRKRLDQMQDYFDKELFNHDERTGAGEDKYIEALHDPQTNEVLWVEGAENQKDLSSFPNAIKRKHPIRVKNVGVEIGTILTDPNMKNLSEAINKVNRKGIKNGSSLSPQQSVPDRARMMFVSMLDFNKDGEHIAKLKKKVKDILTTCFDLDPTTAFQDDDITQSGSQYKKHNFTRLNVFLPGLEDYIEIIFEGIGDHLNNQFSIGNIDPLTGLSTTYAAHALYDLDRDQEVFKLYFPREIYTLINYEAIFRNAYDRTYRSLRGSEQERNNTTKRRKK